MNEPIRGDILTKQEMKQRGIKLVNGTRGGIELRAPTYEDLIATKLTERGFLDDKHLNAACDYLELKNSVYGFLSIKTMAGILETGEAGLKKQHAQAAYYTATRFIGRINDSVVTRAMNEAADETLESMMVVNAYMHAFHAVRDGMDLAKKMIAEEIEKELA